MWTYEFRRRKGQNYHTVNRFAAIFHSSYNSISNLYFGGTLDPSTGDVRPFGYLNGDSLVIANVL